MKRFLHDNLHCLCGMITMLFLCVFLCFELDVFAAGINFSSETYADNWNIDPDDITISTRDNYVSYLEGLGYSNFSIGTNDINNNTHGDIVNFVRNAIFPSSYDDGSVVHDLSNCPFFIGSSSAYNEYGVYFILDKSYSDIENELISYTQDTRRIRSLVNQSILYLSYNSSYTYVSYSVYTMTLNSTQTSYMYTVDIKYYYDILSNAIICFPTSGISGNYTSSQNYSESNCLNFNMNYDLFRSSPTPTPVNPLNDLITENNYANLTSYISGLDDDSLQLHMHFSLPDFIYNYPEYYNVNVVYQMIVDSAASQFSEDYGYSTVIPMRAITGYGHNRISNNSFNDTVNFSNLVNSSDVSFEDSLKNYWVTKSNSSSEFYDSDSVLTFDPYYGVDMQTSQGKYLKRSFASDLEQVTLKATIFISDSTGTNSGGYITTFDLLDGSQEIVQNDIGIRYDPDTNEPNFLPITDLSQYFPQQGSSGGTVNNITVNGGSGQNYYQPFVLDDVTVAGVADQWNYIIRNMQDSDDENSFWGVIKGVYDYIPSPVWGWALTAIASVLGCAVFKFYITSIRI